MTLAPNSDSAPDLADDAEVYLPQDDSHLLVQAMLTVTPPRGLRVADLCTGSGVVAIAAAAAGARSVSAFDRCPRAAAHARSRAAAEHVPVEVFCAPWTHALSMNPFDLVVCNPPYVPRPPGADPDLHGVPVPALAVDGGADGREVLDPLCAVAPRLLRRGGTLLVVQSEVADISATVRTLSRSGLRATVVAELTVPFGPVLRRRAPWLEQIGRLPRGRNVERLAVIAGVKS